MKLKEAELILMKNLKGQKNKRANILQMAKATAIIKKSYSNKEIHDMFGITNTSFERVNTINKLNQKGKNLVKKGTLKIEQGYHLSRIEKEHQDEVADIIATMNAHNTRLFTALVRSHKNTPIKKIKENFDKQNLQSISVVVVPMPNDLYLILQKKAASKEKEVNDLILDLVRKYVAS